MNNTIKNEINRLLKRRCNTFFTYYGITSDVIDNKCVIIDLDDYNGFGFGYVHVEKLDKTSYKVFRELLNDFIRYVFNKLYILDDINIIENNGMVDVEIKIKRIVEFEEA